MENRAKLHFILIVVRDVTYIHFCCEYLLSGANHNLWFPIDPNNLFRDVENIMKINQICHNITSIEVVRQNNETSFDYKVIYNKVI